MLSMYFDVFVYLRLLESNEKTFLHTKTCSEGSRGTKHFCLFRAKDVSKVQHYVRASYARGF